MIVSASRRTDIPAFYAEWFMNRIRAGECEVPNPYRPSQIARVSLRPEEVDVIAFWTRDPRPLLPHLGELEQRGYRFFFLYTLMDNPRWLDPRVPAAATGLDTFALLSERLGAGRVIWRYDPIVLSERTGRAFHEDTFERLAQALRGRTRRCLVSGVDLYRKAAPRLRALEAQEGVRIEPCTAQNLGPLVQRLAAVAGARGLEVFSCAEAVDLAPFGVPPGACLDAAYLAAEFGIRVPPCKDPCQRPACGCVASRDIGVYDTCGFGCRYCYATASEARAAQNRRRHDPAGPALVPSVGAQA